MIEELVTDCPNLAVIEYHSLDEYSNVYSEARVEFYNIQIFPNSHIDGIYQPNWSSYAAYVQAYDDRMELSTNYSLVVSLEGDGTNFSGTVNVSSFSANNEHKVLHIVLTESHIEESWYGGEEVNYVARLMVPDQYGTPLLDSKNPETIFDIEFSLEEGWVKDSCELVVFVQDTLTQEIFQANALLLSDVEVTYHDAAIESIEKPGDVHCSDSLSPVVTIRNLCTSVLESLEITYVVNGATYDYSWTGSLQPETMDTVTLPKVFADLGDENIILVSVSQPNGEFDQNPENDALEKTFGKAMTIGTTQLIFELQTDDFGGETTWVLIDGSGVPIDSGGPYENNTFYEYTWDFPGSDCYTFTLTDTGNNGICCQNGNGFYRIRDLAGTVYFEGGEFEGMTEALFDLDAMTGMERLVTNQVASVFPNPASDELVIHAGIPVEDVILYNNQGQAVLKTTANTTKLILDVHRLPAGFYILWIETNQELLIKKVLIRK